MTNEELGQWGEETACSLLVSKGYKIEARNFRFKKHEIDIVLSKNDSLIIAEVKTRQTAEIGEPWKAVTRNKQRQIIKVAKPSADEIAEGLVQNFNVDEAAAKIYAPICEHNINRAIELASGNEDEDFYITNFQNWMSGKVNYRMATTPLY